MNLKVNHSTFWQTEFEETILEDLRLLDIQGDVVTHTSDHFQTIYDLAIKLIMSGGAYTDDTSQQQVCLISESHQSNPPDPPPDA